MILGKIIFDHRPPLALRAKGDNATTPTGWLRFVRSATNVRRRATSRTSRGPSDWHSLSKTSSSACAKRFLDGRCRQRDSGGNWCAVLEFAFHCNECETIEMIEGQAWTCRGASV